MGGCFSSPASCYEEMLSKQLLEAAERNDFGEVARLIAKGADMNAVNNDGTTAFMIVASKGHTACLDLLLKNGADVNAADNDGKTALMAAAMNGHTACLDLLLKNGADVNADNEGQTALMWAAAKGHIACLDVLLKNGADVNAANSYRVTALMGAALKGHTACLDLLLKNGANENATNKDGTTALIWAAQYGHTACLDLLLKNAAGDTVTALMKAAYQGHTDCLDLLLKNGADVNAADKDGWTPLMFAAACGRSACLDLLLSNGADVNAADKEDGRTALTKAASKGHTDCVKLLLTHSSKMDVGKLKEALEHAVKSKQNESASMIRNHINKLTAQPKPQPPPEGKPLPTATNSYGSSILSPLPWASNATDSIPQATAPMQTLQPKAALSAPAPTTKETPLPLHIQQSNVSYENWVIPYEQLQLGTLLGKGSYAKVFHANWHGSDVAAKVFEFPGGSVESEAEFAASLLNKIKEEADLLASIRHPHVVAFLAMCTDPPCMVTELCAGGSVFDMMKLCKIDSNQATTLTWNRRLSMLIDAAGGMSHLHQRKPPILHRDLKSLNLLIDSAWRVKIADLGLSRLMEEVTAETHAGSTANNMNPRWLAAEVLETGTWLPASDVYAFGVVMWELLTWELPWSHINQFMIPTAILRGDALPIPELSALPGPKPASDKTLDGYVDLLKECMDKTASKRPTFVDIIRKVCEMAADEK